MTTSSTWSFWRWFHQLRKWIMMEIKRKFRSEYPLFKFLQRPDSGERFTLGLYCTPTLLRMIMLATYRNCRFLSAISERLTLNPGYCKGISVHKKY